MAGWTIYRSHKYHKKRTEEQIDFERTVEEETLTAGKVIELSVKNMSRYMKDLSDVVGDAFEGLRSEDLNKLSKTKRKFQSVEKKIVRLKHETNNALDIIEEDEIEAGHLFLLVVDYLREMARSVNNIITPSQNHVDNNHKPLIPVQIEELQEVRNDLEQFMISTINLFKTQDAKEVERISSETRSLVKTIRKVRKNQIKRIKNHEIGTRNSMLYLNHLGELRNMLLFNNLIVIFF